MGRFLLQPRLAVTLGKSHNLWGPQFLPLSNEYNTNADLTVVLRTRWGKAAGFQAGRAASPQKIFMVIILVIFPHFLYTKETVSLF